MKQFHSIKIWNWTETAGKPRIDWSTHKNTQEFFSK